MCDHRVSHSLVREDGGEPPLGVLHIDVLAARVIDHLVACDLSHCKVFGLVAGQIHSTHTSCGPHRQRICQLYSCGLLDLSYNNQHYYFLVVTTLIWKGIAEVTCLHEVPDGGLLGVVGLGGIAGSRSDALVLDLQEVSRAQSLLLRIAPVVHSHILVQLLCKGLCLSSSSAPPQRYQVSCARESRERERERERVRIVGTNQTIGQGLCHDDAVVVVEGAVTGDELFGAEACADGEHAHIVCDLSALWRHKIAQGQVRLIRCLQVI